MIGLIECDPDIGEIRLNNVLRILITGGPEQCNINIPIIGNPNNGVGLHYLDNN